MFSVKSPSLYEVDTTGVEQMLQDVQAGKLVELDARVTAVRELGQLTAVPTHSPMRFWDWQVCRPT